MRVYILILTLLIFVGCSGTTLLDKINSTEDNITIEREVEIEDNNISDETNSTETNSTEDNITIEIEVEIEDNNISDETNSTETNSTEDNITIEIEVEIEDNNISNETNSTETNSTEDNKTINIEIDTTPPTIRLNGNSHISIPQNGEYIELSAEAIDNHISIDVDIDGFVDVTVLGEYNITYSATDSAGNSVAISRQVLVEESRTAYNKVETIPQNWYIRIVAQERERAFKTENTQLGVLEDINTSLKHSLKALAPYGRYYLDIVFPNPVGLTSGDYKTSFYHNDGSLNNVWNMQVKTDNTDASIELSWRGIYIVTPYQDEYNRTRYKESQSLFNPLAKYMKLVDMSSGEEIPAIYEGKVQKYQFSMGGVTTKNFQWVVSDEVVDINSLNRMPKMFRRAKVIGTPYRPTVPFDIHTVPRIDTFDKYTK